MKFTVVFAFIAALVLAVSAVPSRETNAQRLARGLGPLKPRNLGSPVGSAKRASTSSVPSQCDTGDIQCCNSVQSANSSLVSVILGLLGIVLDPTTMVGVTCSPISVIGGGSSSCTQEPVCCSNNSFNGVIAIGCSPININL